MDELIRMLKLAGQGFHCSQVLLHLGLEAQGKENPDLIRSMAGLAGGVGFCGDICGASNRRGLFLGIVCGPRNSGRGGGPAAQRDGHRTGRMFTQEFSECYGGIHCREILADDPRNQTSRCPDLVTKTYEKVKLLLVENGFDLSEGR